MIGEFRIIFFDNDNATAFVFCLFHISIEILVCVVVPSNRGEFRENQNLCRKFEIITVEGSSRFIYSMRRINATLAEWILTF